MLKITVTEQDIQTASRERNRFGYAQCCPIAQALKRMGITFSAVGCSMVWFNVGEFAPLPEAAKQYARLWDKYGMAQPEFTFELDYAS